VAKLGWCNALELSLPLWCCRRFIGHLRLLERLPSRRDIHILAVWFGVEAEVAQRMQPTGLAEPVVVVAEAVAGLFFFRQSLPQPKP
jgi:hypothetical protein